MNNPYVAYYNKQIGRGIPGFRGMRYQKGYGLLSSLLSKAIVPLFKSVKSIDPASLVKSVGSLLSSPGLQPGKPLADDIARIGATAAGSLINSLQTGKGRKRYKRAPRKKRCSVVRGSPKCTLRKRRRRSRKLKKKRRCSKRLHRNQQNSLVRKKRKSRKGKRKRKSTLKLIDALSS